MRWITSITLNNFRAFGKPETIQIPKGCHLLIYGENGSGKSSIFNGLHDFFSSSIAEKTVKFKLNKFEETNGNLEGSVSLEISDDENNTNPIVLKFAEPYTLSDHQQPTIILANKFKGFLDYKRMLKIHALEIPENEKPNIFNLLVNELLSEHKIPDPKGGVTTVELLSEYNRLVEILTTTQSRLIDTDLSELQSRVAEIEEAIEDLMGSATRVGDLSENEISDKFTLDDKKESIIDAIKIIESKEHLVKLDASFKNLLIKVITIANSYLNNYFKNKLFLDVNYRNLEYFENENVMNESLSLKIKYAGVEIEHYQAFLNEARLSSLAICLYLASIRTFEPGEDSLKVLYLDDVFIGLDTSNRFPLLEIINKEFIDNGFQVFISTYDKEWFELSQLWFQNKTKAKISAIELFVEDDGDPNTPDYPVILPYEGFLNKAKAYFKAKDYPAAGNYLRKECEHILKSILPPTFRIGDDAKPITNTEKLFQKLSNYYEECFLPEPQELINSVKIYRKLVLNPSSHSDLKSPIYRSEVLEAFKLIEELKKINLPIKTKVLDKGQALRLNLSSANFRMDLELASNLYIIEQSGVKSLSSADYFVIKWKYKDTDFGKKEGSINMRCSVRDIEKVQSKKFKLTEIASRIKSATGIIIPHDLESYIMINSHGSINDLLK